MSSRTERILKLVKECGVTATLSKDIPGTNINKDNEVTPSASTSYTEQNVAAIGKPSNLDYSSGSSDNYVPEDSSDSSDSSTSSGSSSKSNRSSNSSNQDKTTKNNYSEPYSQKRKANVSAWKKNIRKEKRLKGEPYIGSRNIEKPARPILPSPCSGKLKHKCDTLVKDEVRQEIYGEFRKMTSIDDQRNFVINHVEQKLKKRITRNIENSRRTFTCNYTLTVDRQKITVCREFFMSTLNVTDSFIRTALRKRSSSGIVEKDKRGKHTPYNKLTKNADQMIRDQILSFPAVESHYCRSSTQKKYLDSSLNISIMHNMYKTMCKEKSVNPVSIEKYRQIFREYNLGFFKPKKDQCKKCLAQNNMTEVEKIEQKESFTEHIERKKLACKERDDDKTAAKENPEVLSFNFDLEAVLTTPKGAAGQIFYLRKLAIYNLTVYNLGNQDGICYLWDEAQGKRGSNEIASCIYNYILSHQEVKEVRMMSDGCGGQQKNSNFAAMCIQLLLTHPNLKQIDHKFFETGHTEMECDSIHSKIEKKVKHVPVYTPEGWAQVIRSARTTPRPFVVHSLTYEDFLDFKTFSVQSFILNKIPWRKICWLRYIKNEETKLFYKTHFNQAEFQEMNYLKNTRGRPKNVELKNAYNSVLPISKAKFEDLQKMCRDLTIPKIYHNFYGSMTTSTKIRDNLPEPGESEESESEGD